MNNKTVTDDQFENAYLIIAKIVHQYGEIYLPVFKRFHEEKEKRKSLCDLKSIALQAAINAVNSL